MLSIRKTWATINSKVEVIKFKYLTFSNCIYTKNKCIIPYSQTAANSGLF